MRRAIAHKPQGELVAGFDYAALDPATASEAQALANRVRGFERRLTREVIDLGSQLIRMKDRLPHGTFLPWLQSEFGDKIVRTAQRWMVTAEAFAPKSDKLSYLPPTTLHLLAEPSTPTETREAIVARIEAGAEPASSDIVKEVKAARAEAKKTPEQLKRERDRAARQKRADAAWKVKRDQEHEEFNQRMKDSEEAGRELVRLLSSRLTLAELEEVRRLLTAVRAGVANLPDLLSDAIADARRR